MSWLIDVALTVAFIWLLILVIKSAEDDRHRR